LVPTAQQLARHGELAVTPEPPAQLGRISVATVQRRLTRLVQDTARSPRRGPERANRVARVIPMQRIRCDIAEPGLFEADLVHHSRPNTGGDYVHTLQMVDVATGWSERLAVPGRRQRAMEAGFRRILARLPFRVVELHPDNGLEILNHHPVRFWGTEITGLRLSRSRPYRKNDNRFVEQKNATLIRAYLGQARLDTAEQCAALNALYDRMWVYHNLFQPVLHLIEKAADGPGSAASGTWPPPRSPACRQRRASGRSTGSAPRRCARRPPPGHSAGRSRPASTPSSIPDRAGSRRPRPSRSRRRPGPRVEDAGRWGRPTRPHPTTH
jgi:hypothetical protein